MELTPFLAAQIEHPRFEHLIKVGFFELASDLAYGRFTEGALDETQSRTHRILKVAPEDVAFLRKLDADIPTLKRFQEYNGLKDRQELLLWQRKHKVEHDIVPILAYTTPHKLMHYIDKQSQKLADRKGRYGGLRYDKVQSIVTEYRDYLEMCAKLEYDMGNSFVLFPKDLQEAHDRVAKRVKIKETAQMRQDFKEAMRAIGGHLDFEMDGMKIVLPASPSEVIAEGHALHHCVGNYVERVARHECIILFLRLADSLDKPFYTIEIRNQKAVQVRGMRNSSPTPEVQAFMAQFEQQMLKAAA